MVEYTGHSQWSTLGHTGTRSGDSLSRDPQLGRLPECKSQRVTTPKAVRHRATPWATLEAPLNQNRNPIAQLHNRRL